MVLSISGEELLLGRLSEGWDLKREEIVEASFPSKQSQLYFCFGEIKKNGCRI